MKIALRIALLFILIVSAIAATSSTSSPLDDAKALIAQGKQKDAIPILDKIVASDPTSAPQALLMMGECYKKLGKWTIAIQTFEKLLADHPNAIAPDREVKAWIMDCHVANNEPDKALLLRKDLLNDYGRDAWRLYYIVGRRYLWQHKHIQAIPELEKAIELGGSKKDESALLDAKRKLVQCYTDEKLCDKADMLAQRLMIEHPEIMYEWHYAIGKCHQSRRDYEKAIQSFEKAAESKPKYANDRKNIFRALLDSYFVMRRSEEAIALAQRLIEDYPAEPDWHWELARIYLAGRDYDKAADHFKAVVKSSKERWMIRSSQIYLGESLFKLDRGEEALQGIEDYYTEQPKLWDEHLLVKGAVLLYGPEDSEGCVASMRELLAKVAGGEKSGLVSTAKELMYKAFVAIHDRTADGSVGKEIAAQSWDAALMCQVGDEYYQAGKRQEARRAYKIVLDQAGVSDQVRAKAMYGHARCYWDMGLKNAARRLMQRVSEEFAHTDGGRRAQAMSSLWAEAH